MEKAIDFLGAYFSRRVRRNSAPKLFHSSLLGSSWAHLSSYKKVWMPGTSESEKFICFSTGTDFPKMGILEVDKSKSILKQAQDGNDENFTKKGVLEKKVP